MDGIEEREHVNFITLPLRDRMERKNKNNWIEWLYNILDSPRVPLQLLSVLHGVRVQE